MSEVPERSIGCVVSNSLHFRQFLFQMKSLCEPVYDGRGSGMMDTVASVFLEPNQIWIGCIFISITSGVVLLRSSRALWLAKANARSSAIFCDELNASLFKGFSQFQYCPFLCSECTRLSFEPFHAGKRHSRGFGEFTLLPSQKRSRRSNLLTRQRQSNTSDIEMA